MLKDQIQSDAVSSTTVRPALLTCAVPWYNTVKHVFLQRNKRPLKTHAPPLILGTPIRYSNFRWWRWRSRASFANLGITTNLAEGMTGRTSGSTPRVYLLYRLYHDYTVYARTGKPCTKWRIRIPMDFSIS